MEVMIEYDNNRYIEFENHAINLFVGYNNRMKWQLMRSLYRFKEGKQLTSSEENIYGDDGLTIKVNDKKLNMKQLSLFFMTNFQEFNEQLSLKKNTLMFDYLSSKMSDIRVQNQYEKMLDQMLLMENTINQLITSQDFNLSFQLSSLTLDEMLKRGLMLGKQEQALQLMDANDLFDNYMTLLRSYLESHDQYVMLVIRHEQSFLNEINCIKLYETLRELSELFPKLIVLKIHDENTLYQLNGNIEEVIFMGEVSQQLPPLDIIYQTIYLHYPYEYQCSEEELYRQLCDILPILAMDKKYGKQHIDVVLYEVIQKLLKE